MIISSNLKIKLFYTLLSIFLSLLFGFIFYFKYNNIHAATCSLLSALPSVLVLIVHVQYIKEIYKVRPYLIKYHIRSAAFFILVGILLTFGYIVMPIVHKNNPLMAKNMAWGILFSLFLTKWSVIYLFVARKYMKLYAKVYTLPKYTSMK